MDQQVEIEQLLQPDSSIVMKIAIWLRQAIFTPSPTGTKIQVKQMLGGYATEQKIKIWSKG